MHTRLSSISSVCDEKIFRHLFSSTENSHFLVFHLKCILNQGEAGFNSEMKETLYIQPTLSVLSCLIMCVRKTMMEN